MPNSFLAVIGNIFRRVSTQKVFLNIMFALVLIFAILQLQRDVLNSSEKWANEWIVPLAMENQTGGPSQFDNIQGNEQEKLRLEKQIELVRVRAKTHRDVMLFFYTRYYMAITIASVAGVIAAVILVLSSVKGWTNLPSYGLTALFVFAGVSAYFGSFPLIYQQDSNIVANKNLYLGYIALDYQIMSFIATNKTEPGGEPVEISDYILAVDQALLELNKLPLGFEQPDIKDYVKRVQELTTSPAQ